MKARSRWLPLVSGSNGYCFGVKSSDNTTQTFECFWDGQINGFICGCLST